MAVSDTFDRFNVLDYGANNTGTAGSGPSNLTAFQACQAAAVANYQATGRLSEIYFPGGFYRCDKGTNLSSVFINGQHGLIFRGERGRTRILKDGNAGGGDWHLFRVTGGSSNIYFRDLILDGALVVNPDPGEQDHLINLGDSCSNIVIEDCELWNSIGDGIRLLGDPGLWVTNVEINRCRFVDCGRAGVSFQRYARRARVLNCYFYGGTDQQCDFEPTGFAFGCWPRGAGTQTVLVAAGGVLPNGQTLAAAAFVTWGVQPGDLVRHRENGAFAQVVSVDSETQITTTPLPAGVVWDTTSTDPNAYLAASFQNENDHQIIGNTFDYSKHASAVDTNVTLTGATRINFSHNTIIDGCIQGGDVFMATIHGNTITTPRWGTSAAITLITLGGENQIHDNVIVARNAAGVLRTGIDVTHQSGQRQSGVSIKNNVVRLEAYGGVGITVESSAKPQIKGNTIVKANTSPATTNDVGINLRATAFVIDAETIEGNIVYADPSYPGFSYGMQISTSSCDVATCLVGTNSISNANYGIVFNESVGKFLTPPVVGVQVINSSSTAIGLPASVPWIQIGGIGGTAVAAAVAYAPKVFWGNGSPEGVLAAPVGSIALRRDGTACSTYFKETGTGNTGWVPNGSRVPLRTVTNSASVSAVSSDGVLVIKGSTAPVTVNLPAASTVPSGFTIRIKDGDGGAATYPITITRAGTNLIDGATTRAINTARGVVALVCDGVSSWYVL